METEETDSATLLKEFHHDKAIEYLPVMIFFALMAILGIFGNTCTIRFYSKESRKSSTSILIQCLGVIDLCVCIIVFPSIANLAVNVYFTSATLCQFMYFLDHSFILSSVLVLWIISIDRYLKVCRPLGRQLPTTWPRRIVIVVIIFSIALSSCDFLAYDSVPVELSLGPENHSQTRAVKEMEPVSNVSTHKGTNKTGLEPIPITLYGHYCTSTENKKIQSLLRVFNVIEIVVIVIVLLTFITAYGRILHVVLKNSKQSVNKDDGKSQDQDSDNHNCMNIGMAEKSPTEPDSLASTSTYTNKIKDTRALDREEISNTTERNIKMNKRKGRSTEANISAMMATVSLGFVLSFIPYFIIAGTRTQTKTSESELSALHQLALRSPYLNSVINPIIFCIFNPRYRKYIQMAFIKKKQTENSTPLNYVGETQTRDDIPDVQSQTTIV